MTMAYLYFISAYILTFAATYFGVEKFRQWSLHRNLLDIPNERSSHSQPVPRGGGLILAATVLIVSAAYCIILQVENVWAFFVGAVLITLISWLDDLYTISFVWRFIVHILAAGLVIFNFGFWDNIYIPLFGEISLGIFGMVLTFFWIVWLINAYNFMDGIDGIAGMQAVSAGIGWFLVGLILKTENTAFFGIIVAISGLAFLLHNWQPAKIFMGDVGSAFLGFVFAVLPLLAISEASASNRSLLPFISIVLVSTFVFDSLFTVTKRIIRFEKIWKPHREHIYQILVISGLSHQLVTLIYFAISGINTLLIIIWLIFKEKLTWILLLSIFIQFLFLYIYHAYKKRLT